MTYYTNDFEEFQTLIDILCDSRSYKYVYVSLGGKMNDYHFSVQLPHKTVSMVSNAHRQMCPSFLYDRDAHVLMVCVDRFKDESDEKTNRDICKNMIQRNMDFIFYDHDISLDSISEFFKYFTSMLENIHISPEKFMVCNYVHFLNDPNIDEVLLDSRLSETVVLSMPEKYKGSLFEWFGYNPNLYNMIFNYQDYHITNLTRLSQMSQFLKNAYGDSAITHLCASNLNDYIPSYAFLEKFMNHTVDITSYYHGEKIADVLSEWV